jgi:SulP family sulfate permease
VRDVERRPVAIDLSQAHFWDITSVHALDKICQRLRKHGSVVEVLGMNRQSRELVSRLDLGID